MVSSLSALSSGKGLRTVDSCRTGAEVNLIIPPGLGICLGWLQAWLLRTKNQSQSTAETSKRARIGHLGQLDRSCQCKCRGELPLPKITWDWRNSPDKTSERDIQSDTLWNLEMQIGCSLSVDIFALPLSMSMEGRRLGRSICTFFCRTDFCMCSYSNENTLEYVISFALLSTGLSKLQLLDCGFLFLYCLISHPMKDYTDAQWLLLPRCRPPCYRLQLKGTR